MSTSFIKASILCFVISFANFGFADSKRGLDVKDIVQCFSRTKDCGDDCCAKLSLAKICARRIRAECLDISSQINAANICSAVVNTDSLCATNACIGTLRANSICSSSPLITNQIEQCGIFRATAAYSVDTVYTLGDPLNFDLILDDPNSNVETVFPDTTYTAPRSGYYIVTIQVNQDVLSLISPAVILGTPIADVKVLVNGIAVR